MKKIILIGSVGVGKTTLTQALRGEERRYSKTQYVHHGSLIIDTPGEYIETKQLGGALALYAYEADVVGLVISAEEPFSQFSPNITGLVNRPVIGIVSGIDRPNAHPMRAERWLRLSGCRRIFHVSGRTGEGLGDLISYLHEE